MSEATEVYTLQIELQTKYKLSVRFGIVSEFFIAMEMRNLNLNILF